MPCIAVIGPEFLFFAILLRVLAGFGYLRATLQGKALPNPVTWLCWGLAPLVAFLAQLQEVIGPTAWVTLALGIGPLLIFAASIYKGLHWQVSKFDLLCGSSVLVGLTLWQATSNPMLAIIFGICADILGGIPTIRKAYSAPMSEIATPYLLSIASMCITLLTITDWYFINFAFPAYILCINLLIYTLVATKIGTKRIFAHQSK